MPALKEFSLEVKVSLLTTVYWQVLAMWPHLTPGWAMSWHSLDAGFCPAPLSAAMLLGKESPGLIQYWVSFPMAACIQ